MGKFLGWIVAVLALVATVFAAGLLLVDNNVSLPDYQFQAQMWSDYPINIEMRDKVTVDGLNLDVAHKVTYDNRSDEYLYYYRIHYTGDSSILFRWDVLDKVLEGNQVMVHLGPNLKRHHEFTIRSACPPKMTYGEIGIYTQKRGEVEHWTYHQVRTAPGPVPVDGEAVSG